MRPHQRVPAANDPENQLVDESILGTTQRRQVEPGGGEERAWIDAPAMGRIEHEGTAHFGGLVNFKGGIKLVLRLLHGTESLSSLRPECRLHYAPKRAIVHAELSMLVDVDAK